MSTETHVLALVGSYRKDCVVDTTVNEVLGGAEAAGALTRKIYLVDRDIHFCMNCRSCMQEPGEARGKCVIDDDLESILSAVEGCDRLVIGAPVNFDNVNAVTRKFLERCAGYGYWPWGSPYPLPRSKRQDKRAVLVSASGAPALMGRYLSGAAKALKTLAQLFGAKILGFVWTGRVNEENQQIPDRIRRKARQLGRELALG